MTRVCDIHVPSFLPRVSLTETALESGVNEFVDKKFPQETGVKTGRGAGPTGSDNKPIPEDEGGSRDDRGRWVFSILFYVIQEARHANSIAIVTDWQRLANSRVREVRKTRQESKGSVVLVIKTRSTCRT